MQEFKASYILNKSEILFLLSNASEVQPSYPAKHILSEYLAESIITQDTIEGLVFKGLISKSSGKVIVEPVISLLTMSVLTANKLWIVDPEGNPPKFICSSEKMYLFVQRYPFIEDAWKITPYQNLKKLSGELENAVITAVNVVDGAGIQYGIPHQDDLSWLEEC